MIGAKRGRGHRDAPRILGGIEARAAAAARGVLETRLLSGGPALGPAREATLEGFPAGQTPEGCRWIHGHPNGVGAGTDWRYCGAPRATHVDAQGAPARSPYCAVHHALTRGGGGEGTA